ncbi:peptidase, partial [Vibrio sp. D173a]|uniref:Ig-like domain-containing protein n=1 Tax=Vibrio sp. D173a TaxID=2836349 RepID=UPI00255F76D6|nr:peptidase [Vibrio sp. D173a]
MGLKLFLGPLTSSEADSEGVTSTSSNFDDNGFNVATFTLAAAEDSCQSKGRLPTSDELKAFATYNGGPDVYDGWPVDLAYWAKTGGIGELIDLRSGLPVQATSPLGYYVSCMNEAGLVVVDADSQLEAVADNADQAVVTVKLTWDDRPLEGKLIEASTPSRSNVTFDETTGHTNNEGVTSFALKTWEAGQVPVNIMYDGETVLTQNVKFIGDEATATLELEVIKTDARYDDPGGNIVEATMMDTNNNPVVGRPVTFTTSEDESVRIKGATVTNAQGKQRGVFVWDDSSTTDNSKTVFVTGSYTPQSTGTQISDSDEITFVSPNPSDPTDPPTDPLSDPLACGIGIDDAHPTNATGECLKIATDYYGNWFTGTPSLALLKSLGYTQDSSTNNTGDTYHSVYRETGTVGPAGEFALFAIDGLGVPYPPAEGAGVGGQHDRWCQKLNELEFFGRTDWAIPSSFEFSALNVKFSASPDGFGWPRYQSYWTTTWTGSTLSYCNFVSHGLGPSKIKAEQRAAVPCYGYTTCWSRRP